MIATAIILTMLAFFFIIWLGDKLNANDDFQSVAEWHNFQSAFDKKRDI